MLSIVDCDVFPNKKSNSFSNMKLSFELSLQLAANGKRDASKKIPTSMKNVE